MGGVFTDDMIDAYIGSNVSRGMACRASGRIRHVLLGMRRSGGSPATGSEGGRTLRSGPFFLARALSATRAAGGGSHAFSWSRFDPPDPRLRSSDRPVTTPPVHRAPAPPSDLRALRLSVRTSDFQSEKTGSPPVGSAMIYQHFFLFLAPSRLFCTFRHFRLRFVRFTHSTLRRRGRALAIRPLHVSRAACEVPCPDRVLRLARRFCIAKFCHATVSARVECYMGAEFCLFARLADFACA